MFSLGGGEVFVILLVALIVLGPHKLPDAARKIGNVMGEIRRMSTGFQNEMRAAIEDAGRPEPAKPNLESVPDERKPAPGGVDGSGSDPRRRMTQRRRPPASSAP